MAPLHFLARYGRFVLVAGLLAGILLPDVALFLRGYLPELVAFLLFVAALRIGPREALGKLNDVPKTLTTILLFQIVIPICLAFLFHLAWFGGPVAFAIVLMASASSISGSANLTLLTGNDAAPALRLLIVGTALLPLTVMPVLWLMPEMGTFQAVIGASVRLLLIIAAAALAAFVLRHFFLRSPSGETLAALDGVSALSMAVVVIGLMSAIGPALRDTPELLFWTLLAACAANFGLQLLVWFGARKMLSESERPAFAIVAGNRNMALFLAALPVAVTDPILLFIGCYQVPMYLTPIVLGRLYRRQPRPT